MKIEDNIRARLESILTNDIRNHAEVASVGRPPGGNEVFEQERDFYERIINTYRSAVREVTGLFEENVSFLSGFSHFVDNVRDSNNFEVICSCILDCVLQDFGAEYCGLFSCGAQIPESVSLEGTREEWKFLRIHSRPEILGSDQIRQALVKLATDAQDPFTVDDVYREPEFARTDFPSVVRSIACAPMISKEKLAGLLVAGHSRPRYFTQNHLRVLKILAGFAAHLRFLTGGRQSASAWISPEIPKSQDVLSVALLDFQISDPLDRWVPPDASMLRSLRTRFFRTVGGIGSIVFHGEGELLVLLPGLSSKDMHGIASRLRQEFLRLQSEHNGMLPAIRMNLGYLTCDGDMDLERVLEMIHQKTNPDMAEEPAIAL